MIMGKRGLAFRYGIINQAQAPWDVEIGTLDSETHPFFPLFPEEIQSKSRTRERDVLHVIYARAVVHHGAVPFWLTWREPQCR